ncbi:MAG: TetR/AcrR family transcriptional regulator [Acidimicrobiia bacterium]
MSPAAAAEPLGVVPLADATEDPVRTRLVRSAAAVFAEKGYDGARVGEIARRAGLTTGAIYANFTGKSELLLEAIRHLSELELDKIVDVIASGADPLDAVAAMGSELATRDLDDREPLLIEAFVAVRRDPDVRDAIRDLIEQREATFAVLVEQARSQGQVIDEIDTDSVTRFCFALVFGFLLFDAMDFAHPEPTAWSAMLRRLVDSFRPGGSTGTAPAQTHETRGEQP